MISGLRSAFDEHGPRIERSFAIVRGANVSREGHMAIAEKLNRQGRRLLLIGIAMFLFTSFWGFAIPSLGSPRAGLSVHTLSAFEGLFLIAQGLLWSQLNLTARAATLAFYTSIYGTMAILGAYIIAAITGYGLETLALMGELPHGLSKGPGSIEMLIKMMAYSSAPTGIIAYLLIFVGLWRSKAEGSVGLEQ